MTTSTKYRPTYTVRKQSSGWTSSEKFFVFKRGAGRVSVHATLIRAEAQSDADDLNVRALVKNHTDDPRPYAERLAEAAAWYAQNVIGA